MRGKEMEVVRDRTQNHYEGSKQAKNQNAPEGCQNNRTLSIAGGKRQPSKYPMESHQTKPGELLAESENTLHRLARTHVKAGCSIDEAIAMVKQLNLTCSPSLSDREVETLVSNAYRKGSGTQTKALSKTFEVEDFIAGLGSTIFTNNEVAVELGLTSQKGRRQLRNILKRFKEQSLIEPVENRSEVWRKLDYDIHKMDLKNTNVRFLSVKYPGGLDRLVNTMPGQLNVIAGDPDAGKTAFCLNFVRMNADQFKIVYFSSEMGEVEMRHRIEQLDPDLLDHPNFSAYERSAEFHDVIRQGEGVINIVDYLEMTNEFYRVGEYLNKIFRKLQGAVALVCLQKTKPGSSSPLGGQRAMEKPRLVLAMSRARIKITKAKNWADPQFNPTGLVRNFRISKGSDFEWKKDWHKPGKKKKKTKEPKQE